MPKKSSSIRLRMVRVEYIRTTSHIVSCLRYDVPAIKLRHPSLEVKIHQIAIPRNDEIVEFKDAREAYEQFLGRFGEIATKVYHDFTAFEREFDACVKRDLQTEDGADNSIDTSAVAVDALMKVEGVDRAVAESLIRSGFTSVEDVAASTLDDLESVAGISPSTSDTILASARGLLASLTK